MSSLTGFSSTSGSAAKNAVIQQIQQEAAIANARQLVTVSYRQRFLNEVCRSQGSPAEHKHELLREVRSETWRFTGKGRRDVHDPVHGKVHVCLEHC